MNNSVYTVVLPKFQVQISLDWNKKKKCYSSSTITLALADSTCEHLNNQNHIGLVVTLMSFLVVPVSQLYRYKNITDLINVFNE